MDGRGLPRSQADGHYLGVWHFARLPQRRHGPAPERFQAAERYRLEKTNPPPNLGRRTFTHSTEVVLWASKAAKGSKHRYVFNYAEMRAENGGKQMQTVWKFGAAGRAEKKHGKHPTQKPISLIDRCLRASTNPET